MRQDYALRYLQKLVDWDESKLSDEVGWLRRISGYKFDNYQDFFAGERFIPALIRWLIQFKPEDRSYAYSLLRDHLVFLSASEIRHLVRRTVPAHFHPIWLQRVASELKIFPYEVCSSIDGAAAYKTLIRRSLFIGLSDGARIDSFRRANIGVISNEQVVVSYELSPSKWKSLATELKTEEKSEEVRFQMVFLIDDFLGSGTTLCRKNDAVWKGKVEKFGQAILAGGEDFIDENVGIVAHHYVGTQFGLERARDNLKLYVKETTNRFLLNKDITLTADLVLDSRKRFPKGRDKEMDDFLLRYYDPAIMTPSLWQGQCEVQNGFADCGLTLVLEHNTPNNSLATLWADSSKNTPNHSMRSLFRRRQRHG